MKEKRSRRIHNILPPTVSDSALASSAAAIFAHTPHLPATHSYSLLQAKLQYACWYLRKTASLYLYRNNKGNLIKSSQMSRSHGTQWRGGQSQHCHHRALSPSLKNVPRNFGCVSKCDKVASTSREETVIQTKPKED